MRGRRLLVSDLDGTFVGDDEASVALWDALDAAAIDLVFATGRRLAGVDSLYTQLGTSRRAIAAICMVGTEIWLFDGRVYLPDPEWSKHIGDGWEARVVRAIAGSTPGLRRQERRWQSPLKSSWYLSGDSEPVVAHLSVELDAAGIEASIVVSGERHVDLIPRRAGKGNAVAYLMDRWGVAPTNVVTAGDSGNDIDMMRSDLGVHSIVVGNAQPELLSAAPSTAFVAAGAYAAGLFEGLVALGWLAGSE